MQPNYKIYINVIICINEKIFYLKIIFYFLKGPVYANRKERGESIFEIDLIHPGIPSQRWAMRGVSATLKPF